MAETKPPSAISAKEAGIRAATALKIVEVLSRPASARSNGWTDPDKDKNNSSKKSKDQEFSNIDEEIEDDDYLNELMDDDDEITDPVSCWEKITGTLSSIWITTDMMSGEETVTIVRTTTRELSIYLVFMGVLCFVTLSNMSPRQFEYTDMLQNGLFMNQSQVGMSYDFWQLMNTAWSQPPDAPLPVRDFLAALYWETMYNDGNDTADYPCPGQIGNGTKGPCPIPLNNRMIMYSSKLLGVPRLRQLRVKNDSCIVPENFKEIIKVCYDSYSPSIEDKSDFMPPVINFTSPTAWRYQSVKELGGHNYWGYLTTYSGAGSYQDLAQTAEETILILRELMEGLWMSRATRFVSVDFTVYNANVNLFCVIKLYYEIPPTGGIIPGQDFSTVKLLKYVSAYDYAVLGGEFIFALFVFYYMIEEILEMKKMRIEYIYSFWNILDLFVIGISISTISFSIYNYIIVNQLLLGLLAEPYLYPDFTNLAFWSLTFQKGAGLTIFVSWIKIFKYISFNKTMTQLSGTLTQCAGDVGAFSIMFFIVFIAYAQFAYLILGAQMEQFSTITNTVFSQFRQILGDFDFPTIQASDKILGPLWFITFVFFVFFILMNMFLAIINDTYSEVKAEVNTRKENFQMGDFILRGFNNLRGTVAERDKLVDIQTTIKLANEDGVVTYEEIRDSLRKLNFSDMEIEVFCAKYDVDGNFEFSKSEIIAIEEGFEDGDRKKFDDDDDEDESKDSSPAFNQGMLDGLQFRVEKLGLQMSQVVKKVNSVLQKLDSIDSKDDNGTRPSGSAGSRSIGARSAGSRSIGARSAGSRSVASAKSFHGTQEV